jgi:hypothetical protein
MPLRIHCVFLRNVDIRSKVGDETDACREAVGAGIERSDKNAFRDFLVAPTCFPNSVEILTNNIGGLARYFRKKLE